ncbi:hypothetical protein KFL_005390020 [Klebsormidium nitens]|uniref:Protein HGH1 homolog n=1 Tax=Klebsormidium nitens TaxID=105231 RepID=A0A1Y1IHM4_KLENI|nr:hypothetical protein KFL_005390020 [Klebsormidium nitens]|eukprot:GAQ89582.1 hypothetical protein KFL_005390020 [Klebsormidium nitens]
MPTELEELVDFLSSPRPELRKGAVDIVQGLSGSDQGLHQLLSVSDKLLKPLLKLLVASPNVSKPAAAALVNLSQDPRFAENAVKENGVSRAMQGLVEKEGGHNDLLVMLLANLTQTEEGARSLLQVNDEALQGLFLTKLIKEFAATSGSEDDDVYEHVGTVLVNVSQVKEGRTILLDPARALLKHVLPQIQSQNVRRRQGVANALRNCCFDAGSNMFSLLRLSDVLLPALLLPLAGSKPFSKEDLEKMPPSLAGPLAKPRRPELDSGVKVAVAEALYLVAAIEAGRRALWQANAHRILQVGYEDEEDADVMLAYEKVGALFVAGSEGDVPGTGSGG